LKITFLAICNVTLAVNKQSAKLKVHHKLEKRKLKRERGKKRVDSEPLKRVVWISNPYSNPFFNRCNTSRFRLPHLHNARHNLALVCSCGYVVKTQ